MSQLHYCQSAGLLVGTDYIIPSDLSDYTDGQLRSALWGCNNLICTRCGEIVTNTLDPNTPNYSGRTYHCSCTEWIECRWTLLDDPDHDFWYAPPAWKCAGHPFKK